jgi:hypothetical protein
MQEKELILQNLGLNHKIRKKNVTTVYKVQKFRQNYFNAPDDGRVGRNICEIRVWQMKTYNLKELKSFENQKLNFEFKNF